MDRLPCLFTDLVPEGSLEGLVRIGGTPGSRPTDEECLFTVVSVNESPGHALQTVAAYLARVGMEHVHTVDLYLCLIVR